MFLRESSVKTADGKVVKYLHLIESKRIKGKKYPTHKFIYSFGKVTELNKQKIEALARNLLNYLKEDATAVGAESEILWGRAYGGVYLVEELAKILGIRDVLRGALKRSKIASPVEQGIVGMIANRCIAQQSKLRVDEWLKEDVYFPKAEEIRLQHLYRGMDFLESNKDMIEKDLYLKTRDLFNRRVDIVFYNITTIYIEGRGEEESFQYGYRPDRKQVVVGLSVDRDGLPLSSMLFSGSTIDAKTIDEMIGRLSGLEVGRVVFVCDRGMVSEENLKLIESAGYGYLVGVKLRELKAVRDEVLSVKGRFQKVSEKLEVKDVEVGGRRYIVCYNPQEAERDKAIRDEVIRELEAEIEKINKGSLSACVVKDSALKRRYVRELKTGKLTLDRAKIRQESRYDGKYVLLTTERELSAGELALQYKNLFRVERAFRVELCPIYHRVKAHLTLCVLSYFIQRYAELKTGQSWETILRHLNRVVATKILLKNGSIVKRSQLSSFQKTLLNQMDIKEPPLILEG